MDKSAENIKAILEKAKKCGLKEKTKARLTDEQVKQKAEDMRAFYDKLTAKVESDLNEVITSLEQGVMPSSEFMDGIIGTMNHVKTINDVHNTYIPRHDTTNNLHVIRLYVATHYSQEMLDRLENGIKIQKDGEGKANTLVG